MIAIIIKELRENLKWAALMLLALGGAMVYAVRSDVQSYYDVSLLGSTFSAVTALGFGATGLALGLIQTLQDAGSGRWGFLTHRPISRSRIFWGKVIVGLVLYILATGVPLWAAIVWVKTPGHVAAPYEWHMTLPRIAELICGVAWYAAGLLVGIRPGRWVGSRLMPLGIAGITSVTAMAFALDLAQAVLFAATGTLLLLGAAWSAFTANRDFEHQRALPKLLQTICVGTGVVLALICGTAIAVEAIATVGGRTWIYTYHRYAIDKKGRILITIAEPGSVKAVTDLAGRPVTDINLVDFYNNELTMTYASLQGMDAQHLPPFERRDRQRFTNSATIMRQLQPNTECWFYVVHRGTLEGYERYSRTYLGSLGPSGFIPPPGLPQSFPGELDINPMGGRDGTIATKSVAYRLDLPHKKIGPLLLASPDDPIVYCGAQVDWPASEATGEMTAHYYVVATQSTIHILRPDGAKWFDIPLEQRYLYQPATLQVGNLDDGRFMIMYWPFKPDETTAVPGLVIETDKLGQVVARTDLPSLPEFRYDTPPWEKFLDAISMTPAVLAVAAAWPEGRAQISNPASIAGIGLGIVIGLLALAVSMKRFDLSARGAALWFVLTVLLGIAGPLLLMSLRHRWAMVRCPACGKSRVVAEESCAHCNAPFDKPQQEGIEVFETA